METPVIYFYAGRPQTVSVDVRFPAGSFTEWYPKGQDSPGRLVWPSVEILPGEDLTLPSGSEDNHYYAARATDAAPIRVGKEREKLIFYRGAGNLDVSVRPRFTSDGKIEVRNGGPETVAAALVFENRGGKVGYRAVRNLSGAAVVDAPELTSDVSAVRTELAVELVKAGLYPKEARAMLETWRDSWFEEGMRVIYLVPRAMVDAALPLVIAPMSSRMERVFVARVEMVSPAMAAEIETAVKNGDRSVVVKYGRFLQAFWSSLHGEQAYLPPVLAVTGTGGCAN
jgi:hypothetical protein